MNEGKDRAVVLIKGYVLKITCTECSYIVFYVWKILKIKYINELLIIEKKNCAVRTQYPSPRSRRWPNPTRLERTNDSETLPNIRSNIWGFFALSSASLGSLKKTCVTRTTTCYRCRIAHGTQIHDGRGHRGFTDATIWKSRARRTTNGITMEKSYWRAIFFVCIHRFDFLILLTASPYEYVCILIYVYRFTGHYNIRYLVCVCVCI